MGIIRDVNGKKLNNVFEVEGKKIDLLIYGFNAFIFIKEGEDEYIGKLNINDNYSFEAREYLLDEKILVDDLKIDINISDNNIAVMYYVDDYSLLYIIDLNEDKTFIKYRLINNISCTYENIWFNDTYTLGTEVIKDENDEIEEINIYLYEYNDLINVYDITILKDIDFLITDVCVKEDYLRVHMKDNLLMITRDKCEVVDE